MYRFLSLLTVVMLSACTEPSRSTSEETRSLVPPQQSVECGFPGLKSHHDNGVRLFTDLEGSPVAQCMETVQATRKLLDQKFGIHSVEDTTILIGDDVDVLMNRPLESEGRVRHGAYSLNERRIKLNVVRSPIDERILARIIAHETVHQVVHAQGIEPVRGRGAWINEGFATLFENLGVQGDDFSDVAPARIAAAIALDGDGKLWPLDRFLDATQQELDEAPPLQVMTSVDGRMVNRSVSLHQTQAHAAALFLYRRNPEKFERAAASILRRGGSLEELAHCLAVDRRTIGTEFHNWLAHHHANAFGGSTTPTKEDDLMKLNIPGATTAIMAVALLSGVAESQVSHTVEETAKVQSVNLESERFTLGHRFRVGKARRYQVGSRVTTDIGATTASNSPRVIRPAMEEAEVKWMEFVEKENCLQLTDAGNYEIEYGCERFHYTEEIGGKKTFDVSVTGRKDLRKTDVSDPRIFYLAGLIEKPIRYEIDDDLRIGRVGVPSHLKGGVRSTIETGFKKGLQGRYDAMFPKRPVAVGESWEGEIALDSGLWRLSQDIPDIDYKTRITLESVSGEKGARVAKLKVDIRINVKPNQIISDNTFFKLRLDSVSGSSLIDFDIDAGCPLGEESLMTVKMTRIMGRNSTMKIHTPMVVRNHIQSRMLPEINVAQSK